MGIFEEELHSLLEKLQKELVLVYEYEAPSKFPLKYEVSSDLLNQIQPETVTSSEKLSPRPKPPKGRFNPDLLTQNQFDSIFEAIMALTTEFTLEEMLATLSWQQFEDFICASLDHYGYIATRTFRFSVNKKRHEIDILAREGNAILAIDAKHWNTRTAASSALMRVAEEQHVRIKHLAKDPEVAGVLLKRLKMPLQKKFHSLEVYPIILVSSTLSQNTIVNGVPIVDFTKFNEFLNQFHALQPSMQPIIISKMSIQKKLL